MTQLKIAMIGLDTSHAVAFAELIQDPKHPHHVPGGRLVTAFPCASDDFSLSRDRVAGFTKTLEDKHGVAIHPSIEEAVAGADAVVLASSDGRCHVEQFRRIAPLVECCFIDKPLALTRADAEEIAVLGEQHGCEVFSASALRFQPALQKALADDSFLGVEFTGPIFFQPTQPGWFWYGIHLVEMLYEAFGEGCETVSASRQGELDVVVAKWGDGRIGVLRGNRTENCSFGGTIHRKDSSPEIDFSRAGSELMYAALLEQMFAFFRTGVSPVAVSESLEVIEFVEAVNRSIDVGLTEWMRSDALPNKRRSKPWTQ